MDSKTQAEIVRCEWTVARIEWVEVMSRGRIAVESLGLNFGILVTTLVFEWWKNESFVPADV